MSKQTIALLSVTLAALASIGVGAGAIWGWPAGFLACGGLVWVDLFAYGIHSSRRKPTE